MEFFIEDSSNPVWHRIVISEIIMCEQVGKLVNIHRKGKPVISTVMPIDGFRLKYLKGRERFVRTSSEHIVNKDMVISMVERRSILYLKLEDNKEALIRKSHEYAYLIKTNEKKPDKDMDLYKNNQEYIDNVINTYSDCNDVKKLVEEKTGLKLNTKYIRDRYKIIKYSQ